MTVPAYRRQRAIATQQALANPTAAAATAAAVASTININPATLSDAQAALGQIATARQSLGGEAAIGAASSATAPIKAVNAQLTKDYNAIALRFPAAVKQQGVGDVLSSLATNVLPFVAAYAIPAAVASGAASAAGTAAAASAPVDTSSSIAPIYAWDVGADAVLPQSALDVSAYIAPVASAVGSAGTAIKDTASIVSAANTVKSVASGTSAPAATISVPAPAASTSAFTFAPPAGSLSVSDIPTAPVPSSLPADTGGASSLGQALSGAVNAVSSTAGAVNSVASPLVSTAQQVLQGQQSLSDLLNSITGTAPTQAAAPAQAAAPVTGTSYLPLLLLAGGVAALVVIRGL